MALPISVCIPTKDRPEELKRCIRSILHQSSLPAEIVVIDDGNLDPTLSRKMVEPYAHFQYFKKDKPSLSSSKNLTKALATTDLILILDDDTVLDTRYIESIFEIFRKDENKEVGVAGGIVINAKRKTRLEILFKKVFLLDNGKPGCLLPWGFHTGFHGIDRDTQVQWVSGGNSCFRREVMEEFSFEEFRGGRNALEDVEFGWKVSKKYKMILTPKARLCHYHSPTSRESMFDTGVKQAYNRCWIFVKHGDMSYKNLIFFCWAMIGHILGLLATGRSKMALGNITGLLSFWRDHRSGAEGS
jgi:GT2 family glycosyltransferase